MTCRIVIKNKTYIVLKNFVKKDVSLKIHTEKATLLNALILLLYCVYYYVLFNNFKDIAYLLLSLLLLEKSFYEILI